MTLKHLVVASSAVFALAVCGAALAEQPKTPFVSGDEPMNVGDSAQIKAPTPNQEAQGKTEKMLKKEATEITGDYPLDEDDAAQMEESGTNAEE
jgi:hypothetical protein